LKTRLYILLLCCIATLPLSAQLRLQMSERWEAHLHELSHSFTSRDSRGSTDYFVGLHTGQYSGTHHLFGLSVEGGWSAHLTNMPRVSNLPGGGAVGMHLLYEYQYSGLLFQTGFGAAFQQCTNTIADTLIYHPDMLDTWSSINPVPFTLKHHFYGRTDQSRTIYGQIPVYVGSYILGTQGVGYYLLGIKINYAFTGSTRIRLTGSTSGLYEYYIGEWVEMDNHGFRKDVPIERNEKQIPLKIELLGHAEMGYEMSTFRGLNYYRNSKLGQTDARYRIGAYVDMGLLNNLAGSKLPFYDTPDQTIYDFPTYQMNHAFGSKDAAYSWMRNIFVGVRLTVLFGLPVKQRCILCESRRKFGI